MGKTRFDEITLKEVVGNRNSEEYLVVVSNQGTSYYDLEADLLAHVTRGKKGSYTISYYGERLAERRQEYKEHNELVSKAAHIAVVLQELEENDNVLKVDPLKWV